MGSRRIASMDGQSKHTNFSNKAHKIGESKWGAECPLHPVTADANARTFHFYRNIISV